MNINHSVSPIKKEPYKIGKASYHYHSGCAFNNHIDKQGCAGFTDGFGYTWPTSNSSAAAFIIRDFLWFDHFISPLPYLMSNIM